MPFRRSSSEGTPGTPAIWPTVAPAGMWALRYSPASLPPANCRWRRGRFCRPNRDVVVHQDDLDARRRQLHRARSRPAGSIGVIAMPWTPWVIMDSMSAIWPSMSVPDFDPAEEISTSGCASANVFPPSLRMSKNSARELQYEADLDLSAAIAPRASWHRRRPAWRRRALCVVYFSAWSNLPKVLVRGTEPSQRPRERRPPLFLGASGADDH